MFCSGSYDREDSVEDGGRLGCEYVHAKLAQLPQTAFKCLWFTPDFRGKLDACWHRLEVIVCYTFACGAGVWGACFPTWPGPCMVAVVRRYA